MARNCRRQTLLAMGHHRGKVTALYVALVGDIILNNAFDPPLGGFNGALATFLSVPPPRRPDLPPPR